VSLSRSFPEPWLEHPAPVRAGSVSLPVARILDPDPRRPWLAARTRRSLEAAGLTINSTSAPGTPCLLIRAGQVLRAPDSFRPPPLLETRPLVAIGLPASGGWCDFHAKHGGDYPPDLPPPVCEWHASPLTATARLNGEPLPENTRIIHWSPLDLAATDERLAVDQIVTSLQHGGAEKIALDLALSLPGHDIASRLVVLGKPHRRPFESPPGTLDLSHLPRSERAAFLARLAIRSGTDVLHVHLTDAAETRALSKSSIPVIATVHNSRAGWPRDWEFLESGDVSLLLACSQAAGEELRECLPHLPSRTVWNGIRPNRFPETPLPPTDQGFTLACVANPRPQKRLELLPAIVAATRDELGARGIVLPLQLVIAGETSPALTDAIESRAAVDREAVKHQVNLTWTDGKVPVRDVLAKAHALVSCSAHEGLSLAHLEALSSGRPVIACDSGGTRELAWRNPAVTLIEPLRSHDTPVVSRPGWGQECPHSLKAFAKAIADALLSPPPSAHRLVWRDFATDRMASRVARFARQVAGRPAAKPTTLWFVTNNLSMGGAQSSLRRLAKSFHARGHRVRVALLQEYPEHPTAGRTDLLEHGIEVFVPPPCGLIEAQESVDLILAEMTADPPAAVVFWNTITLHKLLLADALPFTPVHDISPGEMWFSSFERTMENPPPGLPCRIPADYGRLLKSFVVKYSAESKRAEAIGAPVKVIPNGVLLPDAPRRRPTVSGPFVFGTAARISPQKRLDELIEAFRLALPDLPGSVLRIAGGVETGAEECAAELRMLAEGLPVEWPGETHDIGGFHAGCDVFVMISDPAGCPNASLEALASGLPVIATDVGGASEQVIDGVNGFLVPARDIPALAKAMIAITTEPARRDAMSLAAREHIRRHFTLERMTSDYLNLFLPDAI
jgi:glycosyltransferase involved in cell wall biosynthesis